MTMVQRDLYGDVAKISPQKKKPRLLVDEETQALFRRLRIRKPFNMMGSVKTAGKLLAAARRILSPEEEQLIKEANDIDDILEILSKHFSKD